MPIDAKWLPLGGAYRKESPIKMPTGSQRRLLSRGGSMPIDAKWLPLGVAYREENPIKKSHTHTHTHTHFCQMDFANAHFCQMDFATPC